MSVFPAKILLATDGSKEAELAARTALDIADSTNSELHVATIARVEYHSGYDIPESGALLKGIYESNKRKAQEMLSEQVKKIEETGGTMPQAHVRTGRPDREIVHLANEIGAGLIVVGSRGHGGVKRSLMGSVSDSVVRHAHCPVLIVREEQR